MEANNNNSVEKRKEEELRRPPLARDETIEDAEEGRASRWAQTLLLIQNFYK